MRSYTNVTDPDDKKKNVKIGKGEKEISPKRGQLNQEILRRGRKAAKNIPEQIEGKENRSYGAPAPRVGGKVEKSGGVPKGAPTVSLMKKSAKRARKSAASPAAKKAAIKALKNRY